MVKANGDRFFFSTNDLYSVYALTDGAGTVVERYCYDPYGAVTVMDKDGNHKADTTYSEFGNPFTFTGRRSDRETGLMQYRFRYYDTELGRFLSRDPIGYVSGMNFYSFVSDKPSQFIDPLGLGETPPWCLKAFREMIDKLVRLSKGWDKYPNNTHIGEAEKQHQSKTPPPKGQNHLKESRDFCTRFLKEWGTVFHCLSEECIDNTFVDAVKIWRNSIDAMEKRCEKILKPSAFEPQPQPVPQPSSQPANSTITQPGYDVPGLPLPLPGLPGLPIPAPITLPMPTPIPAPMPLPIPL